MGNFEFGYFAPMIMTSKGMLLVDELALLISRSF